MSSLPPTPAEAAAAAVLEDDDLLSEILLRLPPQPSSLPRASVVSTRWRSVVSDPRFSRRFRAHHRRNPPLLGYFVKRFRSILFQPALEAPDRVPQGRFSFPVDSGNYFQPLGCRHGLVLSLSFHGPLKQVLVWDPFSADQHRIEIPPGFDKDKSSISAAAVRAAGHFQVVLVGTSDMQHTPAVASVYSSDTAVWGNLVTVARPPNDPTCLSPIQGIPAVMVGDSLYWLLWKSPWIIEFDLARQSLALIPMPVVETVNSSMCVMRSEGGGLGFLFLTGFCAQLWKRKTGSDGVASWVMGTSIQLDKLLSLNLETARNLPLIVGFAEDNNVVLLETTMGVFKVQLELLQFKKIVDFYGSRFYPFECVYTADMGNGGGQDGAYVI